MRILRYSIISLWFVLCTHFIGFVYSENTKELEHEHYFLYPFGHEKLSESQIRWEYLFGLFRYRNSFQENYKEGMFFPFYFFKRGFGVENDYKAIWPLGGTVKNFLWQEQIDWFLWPLYVKTRKQSITNYWYPWPFINYRIGNIQGFGVWPLGGHFYNKNIDERYFLWPLFYKHSDKEKQNFKCGFLPFYAYEKGKNIEDLSIIWPIWGKRKEKEPHYEESRLLWPLFVQGRGKELFICRWAPFYTYSENKKTTLKKTWYLWPFVKSMSWQQGAVDIHQEQFLYFLFWRQEQKIRDSGKFLGSKTHFWPIYSYWEDGKGRKQMQMLSPFEVFFPSNKMVRDCYTPLFNLFRYDEKQGDITQTFLFNLFKEHKDVNNNKQLQCGFLLDYKNTEEEKSFSLLKGFIGYKNTREEKSLRLFWLSISSKKQTRKDIKFL